MLSVRSRNSRRQLGAKGEQAAVGFLENKGYLIKERNYRCRHGEIDIIALYEEYLIFVEVKARCVGKVQVDPLISLTKAKCRRLHLLGRIYRQSKKLWLKQPRFDVIGITFHNKTKYTIQHIENAF